MGRKQDRKPDRKLGARPHPHLNYPVSQGHHFSVKCCLATRNRNPPKIKIKNQHDHIILQGHCTTPPTSQLSTFPVCAGQQILYTTTPTPRPRHLPLGPTCQQIPTEVVSIIELHSLTYDVLPSPRKHVGDTPTLTVAPSTCPCARTLPHYAMPNRKQHNQV